MSQPIEIALESAKATSARLLSPSLTVKKKDVLVSSLSIYVKNENGFSVCIDFSERLKWASRNFFLYKRPP